MAVGVLVIPGSEELPSHGAGWITGSHRRLAHRTFENADFDLEMLQIDFLLGLSHQIYSIKSEVM